MRLILALVVIFCFVVLPGAAALVTQDQDDVRGAFITSRPKEQGTTTQTTVHKRRRPQPAPTPQGRSNVSSNPPATSNSNSHGPTTPVKVNNVRLGLGVSLYMRDSNGLAVRTDPSHVFHRGDRVRVLLETNTDGYLYIFNTTNDGPPVMVYPQVELDDAGNYMQAHVPFEIPSSLASQERLRWLAFDENAGNEKLYFIFSKEPLPGIPIEDDLITYCNAGNGACPLRPPAEAWAKVQVNLKMPLQTARATEYGAAQTSSERTATTRGLGLAQSDPEPSIIMMATSNSSTLVTSLDLIHK